MSEETKRLLARHARFIIANCPEDEREIMAAIKDEPPTKAVLSKRKGVEPTKEAWATEIAWRANYTSTSALDHALDEIVRLHLTLIEMKRQRDARDAAAPVDL